jgi:hypothetical protein
LSWYRNRQSAEEQLGKNVSWVQSSSDGKWLYYIDESNGLDRFGRLHRLSVVDGVREQLDPSAGAAAVSGGGGPLVYVRRVAGSFRLMVLGPDGPTPIPLEKVGPNFRSYSAVVSPDRRWLAFSVPSDLWYAYELATRRLKPLARGWSLDWVGPNIAEIYRSYWGATEGVFYVPLD